MRQFVSDFARALEVVDARGPVATNHRTKEAFRPGVGPHTEAQTTALVLSELSSSGSSRYGSYTLDIAYPSSRQRCDLLLVLGNDRWAIEIKMMRLMGDNGKPNDSILMHILSPYPQQNSALTDCGKLLESGFSARKAILIFGYDYPSWPMEAAIEAFETLARSRHRLSERLECHFSGLCHPVHKEGKVCGWELVEPEIAAGNAPPFRG